MPRPVTAAKTSQEVATTAERGLSKGITVFQFLNNPNMKKELQRAAAANFDVDHLMRITITLIRKTPALAECSQASLAGAMMMSAELGLDPGVLGMVYYVPFNNKIKTTDGREVWEKQVQFMIGYKGLLELVRRSNQISKIEADVVYEGDQFTMTRGSNGKLEHIPCTKTSDRGAVIGAYAYAKMKDGSEQYDFMPVEDIEAIRKRSKASSSGPWVTDWNEMAKKTVLRRLCKLLPLSIRDQRAIVADSAVIHATKAEDIIDLDGIEFAEEEQAHAPAKVQADIETGEIVGIPSENTQETYGKTEETSTAKLSSKPSGIKTPMVGGE